MAGNANYPSLKPLQQAKSELIANHLISVRTSTGNASLLFTRKAAFATITAKLGDPKVPAIKSAEAVRAYLFTHTRQSAEMAEFFRARAPLSPTARHLMHKSYGCGSTTRFEDYPTCYDLSEVGHVCCYKTSRPDTSTRERSSIIEIKDSLS